MNINCNAIVGLYAVPKNYPVTCANPAPWKIEHIKISMNGRDREVFLMIRGEDSMWFRADSCYISDKEDCQEWIEIYERERVMKSLYFTIEV
jgi:hypothetical protein